MMVYTVNVSGNKVELAKAAGYHAYYASGVTAIEIPARSKGHAAEKARDLEHGSITVLYVFL